MDDLFDLDIGADEHIDQVLADLVQYAERLGLLDKPNQKQNNQFYNFLENSNG